jgi:hypothetical protein
VRIPKLTANEGCGKQAIPRVTADFGLAESCQSIEYDHQIDLLSMDCELIKVSYHGRVGVATDF